MRLFRSWLMLVVLLVATPAGAAPDRSADIDRLKPAAEQGDAATQYRVGLLYAETQQLTDAAHWYRLAADQGHHEAQSRLAMLNCNGLGVPKNMDECVRLYRQAAEGGVTLAQTNLAARYLMGDGMPTNHGEAARLARLAADKGDATGQLLLAICYETGVGVGQNRNEALRLYRLSAGQGNASAQKAVVRLGGQPVPLAAPPAATVSASTLTVTLRRQSGVLMVPAVLNGTVSANFVVDSGASDVVIPESLMQEMRKAGKFSDADYTGTQMVKIADGSVVKARTLVLRSFAVGNRVLDNVRASVAPAKAVPLLGQSFLQRFSSWSIDNERQVLLLKEKETMAR
jgi:clan AA aspartic protease (TIGR02281 family)